MTFATMVLARELLRHLTERQVDLIFDLLEDPSTPLPAETARAIKVFLKRTEHELGEDHPVVVEVRAVLFCSQHVDAHQPLPEGHHVR